MKIEYKGESTHTCVTTGIEALELNILQTL